MSDPQSLGSQGSQARRAAQRACRQSTHLCVEEPDELGSRHDALCRMSCGSVPTRFTLHNRRIRALKTLLSAHSRHVRFRQARNHLTAPMWDRMVPVTSASMLWHPLPTYNIGTLHHAAQSITACICKHAPEHNRLSAHNVREGTGLIRAMPCAQAAA